MVKLNKIYTRTGDSGETGLADGSRVAKDDPLAQAIGDVDEANSAIGLALLAITDEDVAGMLGRIQNELFDLGADLCVPGEDGARLRLEAAQSARLDAEIAALNAALPPLRSFVLPGGSPAAAMAHLARTVTRRAERLVVALAAEEALNPEAVRYLNRLSDLLFVLSRRLNGNGAGDVLWVPGATR
jgi:cob(I)alamin adenosyltransferase